MYNNKEKKQRTGTKKRKHKRFRAITLQGVIEKSPILLLQYWKIIIG